MNRLAARSLALAGVVLAVVALVLPSMARACPFCNAAMQTLSQEIEAADVALIAELIEPMPTSSDGAPDAEAAAVFRVVEVLRGEERLAGAKEIRVVYFGDEAPDKKFMITGLAGVTGPGLDWTTPVPLSPRAVDYVRRLRTIPAEGADRLAFFQEYLENDDPLLAQDAYDEFARTPYAQVIELGPRMNRSQLLKWIQDSSVGPSGRRLYLTMLGICGKPEDVGLLESLMHYDYASMKPAVAAAIAVSNALAPTPSAGLLDATLQAEEGRKRESLDALIACYLRLKGPDGLDLINKLFLSNPQVAYKHLHSAIMALRFHGEETKVLPREKLLESMRLALGHRDFADQVIPDLTRWEDWAVMPKLVAMFKESPTDDWIRQPVVSYLLVAADVPGEVGERANAALTELEGLDAETVKRARSLTAFSFLARASASQGNSCAGTTDGATTADGNQASTPADGGSNDAETTVAPVATDPLVAGVPETDADESEGGASAEADDSAETEEVANARTATKPGATPPLAAATLAPPSRIKIIGIPLLAVGVLLAIFAVLLRGADPRSSDENT